MLIEYARVCTDGQDLALQLSALKGVGVNERATYTHTASGKKVDRPASQVR
jgi:hypothetical protein